MLGRMADVGELSENLVRPERFELPTYCSGGNRSIHLSYGRIRFSLHPGAVAINRTTLIG